MDSIGKESRLLIAIQLIGVFMFGQSTAISRRALLGLGVAAATCLSRPDKLYAYQSIDVDGSIYSAFPGLTDEEIDEILKDKIQSEIQHIINDAQNDAQDHVFFDRPTYSTVYGTIQYIWSPWTTLAGQPAGGTSIKGGGMAYATESGGGTISFSYSFPTPYGSFGLSCPLGRKSSSVTSYGVKFPDSNYYKVQQRGQVKAQPYTVYVKQNGVSKVYRRMVSSIPYRNAFRAVRA